MLFRTPPSPAASRVGFSPPIAYSLRLQEHMIMAAEAVPETGAGEHEAAAAFATNDKPGASKASACQASALRQSRA